MNGLEMMLRSFGVDPEEIKKALSGTVEAIKTFDGRLTAIETALLLNVELLERLERKLDARTDGTPFAGDSNYDHTNPDAYCCRCGFERNKCNCSRFDGTDNRSDNRSEPVNAVGI